MTAFVFVIAGIALLLAGGTSLVRGASGVASSFGISPLIIGLTVVAFGTSAPELVVTLVSAARGYSGLAFGNVVGSNLANLGLVLGLSALVTPIAMHGDLVRREVPFLLLVTCITLVVCAEGATSAQAGQLDRAEGLVLLLLFLGFLYVTYLVTRARIEDPVIQGVQQLPVDPPRNGRNWISTIAGALLLAIGGHLTTTYGAELAQQLGFAPVVVGLLIVAVGTSLPELICAASSNEAWLSLS